jgi:16S rRNA (uracil1498-N3)-methyltransferase
MHRFHLPPVDCKGATLLLNDRDVHHASHVLRLRRGDRVTVLDGAGEDLLCEIEYCGRDNVRLAVIQRTAIPPLPSQITLLQAVPKGKIIESIIQKATELGVARIIPLLTERVATRLDDEGTQQKGEKWQQVAIEAIKQCGSAWLPKVEPPLTPREFIARKENFDLPLIASLQPGSRHAHEYFQNYRDSNHRQPKAVCIWVGPEGDFTPEEVAAAQSAGALPITLGRLILRSETAATYCLSILNHELTCPH